MTSLSDSHIQSLHERPRSIQPHLKAIEDMAKGSDRLFSAHLNYTDAKGNSHTIPRFLYAGPGDSSNYLRVGIFAGVHGDEVSGVLASLELIRRITKNPSLVQGYELFIFPVCNPTGFADGTRHARGGADLNREFWRGSESIEVVLIERQLLKLRFNGIIALHTDDTSAGLYGFVKGHQLTRHVLEPALDAASSLLPRNYDRSIDNFQANNGIIETGYTGILSAPPGQTPKPFEIVFETPHHSPLDQQIEAHIVATLTILDKFRTLISEGQNI